MKFLLPIFAIAVIPLVMPACSNLSVERGRTEYRTPAVPIYDSLKLGKLSLAGVVIYDSPAVIDPSPPTYPK